ncbi:hypothetical protein M2407_005167 [Serratia sp. BIGb0234]|uniref:hypothetical protein n=1 Tax=Serratia sp. BIGb0234 TaxID=2940614 RepID=UPI002168CAE3|nr:hypothetical protein [Serratia sp. BIGb0234]MCS4320793.1 hypothetical protein [Serratia sp. BIGb0234]
MSGVNINNNTSKLTKNNAGPQGTGKSATGVSDAKQNENGTLVRDSEHREFLNKYDKEYTNEEIRDKR